MSFVDYHEPLYVTRARRARSRQVLVAAVVVSVVITISTWSLA